MAECYLREILAQRPDYAEARINLALALLMSGRLEEGWRAYESRWEVDGMGAPARVLPQPRWTGQALQGETVLLYAEQASGTPCSSAAMPRWLPPPVGAVVLVVPKALQRVMMTLEGVVGVLTEEDRLPPCDYQCPLLSLPLAFGTFYQTIPAAVPYLHADPAPWTEFLAGCPDLRVGLCGPGSRAPRNLMRSRSTSGAQSGWTIWRRSWAFHDAVSCRCNAGHPPRRCRPARRDIA